MTRIGPAVPSLPEEMGTAGDSMFVYVTNVWSRTVLQPFLIILLATSLVTGILVVVEVAAPAQPWLSLAPLCFFVALEGVYTTLWLNHPDRRITNRLAYRAAEFIFIAVLIRLFAWLVNGHLPQPAQLRDYLLDPAYLFRDGFFLIGLFVAAIAWQRALSLATLFTRLAIDAAEAAYYTLPAGQRPAENRPFMLDRSVLVAAFFQQWIWGGVLLAFCTALTTFDLSEATGSSNPFALTRLGLRPEMLTALLTYFLSGFLLLSQGRLAAVNARWLASGVVKSRRVERSWSRNSLWLLLAVALLAAFLPLGSTLAIGRILEAIFFLFYALFALFSLLLFLLLSLFRPTQIESPPPSAPPDLRPPQLLPPPAPPSETAALILGSLFWLLIIAVTVAALVFFLRDRGYRLNGHLWPRAWRNFIYWWRRLWQGVSTQVTSLRQAVRARWPGKREEAAQPSPWRFIRLNALSPREQIRYFYLSTVRRAGQRGVARQESETPLEYAQDLKENWPDAEVDVESLTGAFLKARYTPQPIAREEVNPVKARWKQLKANLRQRPVKKSGDDLI